MNLLTIVKNELKKKNINNGLWLYFLQIFNTIVPLLTLPYITRVLETTQYGIFSIALNIFGYLQVFIEYGFGMSATREVAIIGRKKKELGELFTSILFARFLLLVSSILATIIFLVIGNFNELEIMCLLTLSIGLIGICFQQNWLFQGLQEMKYISIVNIIARTVSVVLIFLFVKTKEDLLLYCFLYSISPLVSGLLSFKIAKFQFDITLVKVSMKKILGELHKGWYVFTTSLSAKVFSAIGITFLGMMATKSTVGIYTAIQKIPSLIMLMWTPISQIIFPIVSRKMEISFLEGERFVRLLRKRILPLFIFISILVALFSEYLVNIAFGNEYVLYYYWIIPLLIWMILSINNNFLGIQILLASGHDKEYGLCFQVGVIATIVSNFILIYFFGGNGASIAPAISELFLSIILTIQIRKIKKTI